MRKLNPIAIKVRQMVSEGLTSLEKICVVSDLKFPTLNNLFTRDRVSYITLKSLLISKIINEDDVSEYKSWLASRYKKGKRDASKT